MDWVRFYTMESPFAVFAILAIFWILSKLNDYLRHARNRLPFPPGPKPMPIIGNMLDLPNADIAQVYAVWGRKYNSSILHIEALGKHVIIVNSFEDADQLFEQSERARIYADRPHMPIFSLRMKWDYNLALLPYGDWWRQHRKICQQSFNTQVARNYEPIQMKKLRQLLQGLLETPKEFDSHNRMFSIGLTAAMMYGYNVQSVDDPLGPDALTDNISLSR